MFAHKDVLDISQKFWMKGGLPVLRRFVIRVVIAVFIVCAFVGIALSVGYFASPSQAQLRTPPSYKPANMPLGFSAIKPHINLAPSQASKPTFTQADVENFILKSNSSPAGPLVGGAHLTILEIEFTTAKQAAILMEGEDIGIPDNAPVCYVLLQGPFKATGMHLSPEAASKLHGRIPVAKRVDLVLDGRTGNLLVWGIPAGD
jgi:hypothetical protein